MQKLQFYLSPAQGKKLIAQAISSLPEIEEALKYHTIVVVAGTTNAPIAYELLKKAGQEEHFNSNGFFRGVTVPQGITPAGKFGGDVILQKGKWLQGKTIFDIADTLTDQDIVLKGANAVNLEEKEAGVLLGNPTMGTAQPILTAVYGRRVKLYVPVGTEKRVSGSLSKLAKLVNTPDGHGLRLLPLPGEVITELEAVEILTGLRPSLIAGGGILGAEGGCYYLAEGEKNILEKLRQLLALLEETPDFSLHRKESSV
jgi:hypothetical protein